jgi:hypothetical protein
MPEEAAMTETRSTAHAVGAFATALALAALAVANFVGGEDENGGGGPFVVTALLAVALVAALFWWYIPRAERPGVAGVAIGALAVASLIAFWSGLPFVLGPAAALLGVLARRRDARAAGLAAIVLGVAATVGGVAGLVADGLT